MHKLTQSETITRQKFAKLTKQERADFQKEFVENIRKLETSDERGKAVLKYASIIGGKEGTDLRRQTWELNHNAIVTFVSVYLSDNAKMPTVTEISDKTGLSRETVTNHIHAFKKSKFAREQKDRFALLKPKIMGMLYKLSAEGDVRAMRVLLDAIDKTECDDKPAQVTQTNYIQINSVTITQDELQALPPAQRKKIETYILKQLPAVQHPARARKRA